MLTLPVKRFLVTLWLLALVAAVGIISYPAEQAEAQTSDFEYGVRIGHAFNLTDDQLDSQLDKAKDAGATTVQVMASWRVLAPSAPREYDWTYLDKTIAAAEARGLKVHLQLEKTPRWMSADSSTYPPRTAEELAHWEDFAYDLASRYGTRATRYEMWNEPNIRGFWNTEAGPDPAEYAALLRAGYLGAKGADPAVTVTFGGLSNNDSGFLGATYDAIASYPDAASNGNFFDELGVHPYSAFGSFPQKPLAPDDYTTEAHWQNRWGENSGNFLDLERMKATMDSRGDTTKKIYVGEYGFSHEETWMQDVPDETRAVYLKKAYQLAKARPWVSGLSWYSYYEDTPWAIVASDGTESLTFRAFREATGAAPAAQEATIAVSADTAIMQNSGSKNYGDATSVTVDGDEPSGSGSDSYALLKFDLSQVPAGKSIQSARLKLNITNSSPSTYQIYGAKNNWRENQATWHRRDMLTRKRVAYWEVAGAKGTKDRDSTVRGEVKPSAAGAMSSALNADGVALVQRWLDTPSSNYGVIVANSSNNDGFDFNTKGTVNPPTLVLTYK